MSQLDVSVVIVNCNGGSALGRCVRSVIETTREVACEVILVDNASADGSTEKAKEDYPDIVLIQNRENEGFARACNTGIRASKGRKILLLNSDTVVRDEAVGKMSNFLDQHPKAGIAGCGLVNEDETHQKSAGKVRSILHEAEERLIRFGLRKRIRVLCSHEERFAARVRSVDWVSGAFLMVRRTVIERIGLLDERMFLFFEDIEWCARARDAGWAVLYDPGVRVLHTGGQSVSQTPVRAALEYRRSQLVFYKTRYGNGPNTKLLKVYLLFLSLWGIASINIVRSLKGRSSHKDLAERHQMYKQLFRLARQS